MNFGNHGKLVFNNQANNKARPETSYRRMVTNSNYSFGGNNHQSSSNGPFNPVSSQFSMPVLSFGERKSTKPSRNILPSTLRPSDYNPLFGPDDGPFIGNGVRSVISVCQYPESRYDYRYGGEEVNNRVPIRQTESTNIKQSINYSTDKEPEKQEIKLTTKKALIDETTYPLFECILCMSLLSSDSYECTTCTGIYCTPCIEKSLTAKKECPSCRKYVDSNKTGLSKTGKFINKLIEQIKVQCPENLCEINILFKEIDKHNASCSGQEQCQICNKKIPKSHLNHQENEFSNLKKELEQVKHKLIEQEIQKNEEIKEKNKLSLHLESLQGKLNSTNELLTNTEIVLNKCRSEKINVEAELYKQKQIKENENESIKKEFNDFKLLLEKEMKAKEFQIKDLKENLLKSNQDKSVLSSQINSKTGELSNSLLELAGEKKLSKDLSEKVSQLTSELKTKVNSEMKSQEDINYLLAKNLKFESENQTALNENIALRNNALIQKDLNAMLSGKVKRIRFALYHFRTLVEEKDKKLALYENEKRSYWQIDKRNFDDENQWKIYVAGALGFLLSLLVWYLIRKFSDSNPIEEDDVSYY